MLASFIYVGREALEMMFLLFMITATVSLDKKMITAGVVGLVSETVAVIINNKNIISNASRPTYIKLANIIFPF